MHMAAKVKPWTIEELHRLPDDGNKYELVRGELFVTPAPSVTHETILARLTRLLDPFVAAHELGFVYHPRAVMQFEGSEVEPDLMVRQPPQHGEAGWANAPTPILVVEVLSDSTRRRDLKQKRDFYRDAGVDEYWVVDPETETMTSIRRDRADVVAGETLAWNPPGVSVPLAITVASVFE